jgi:hypothetical protein
MHSFLRVVEALAEDGDRGPFLISTVDAIAAPGVFGAFAAASRESEADVILAVTPSTDDEKPLLVRLGPDGVSVEAIGESVRLSPDATRPAFADAPADRRTLGEGGQGDCDDALQAVRGSGVWATAGYYVVRSSVLREADEARHDGVGALRLFFERLLARGYRLQAVPVAGGVDVDRPADVRAAETFLKQVG